MKRKLLLIVNPAAGRGAYKQGFADALYTLSQGGCDTTVYFTEGRGDATVLALIVKLTGLDLYRVSALKSVLGSVAGAATPLCLFILGASFSLQGLRGAARSLWITVAGRLLLVPTLTIAAAALLGFRGPALGVIMVCFGAPTAVSSYNMAREIGGDADLAAGIVVVTTALSCVSLFCWIVLLKTLGLF